MGKSRAALTVNVGLCHTQLRVLFYHDYGSLSSSDHHVIAMYSNENLTIASSMCQGRLLVDSYTTAFHDVVNWDAGRFSIVEKGCDGYRGNPDRTSDQRQIIWCERHSAGRKVRNPLEVEGDWS